MVIKKSIFVFSLLILFSNLFAEKIRYHSGKKERILYLSEEQNFLVREEVGRENRISLIKSSEAKSAKKMFKSSKILPVFSDDPNGGGRIRTLPGGVIVEFKNELSKEEIEAWAKQKDLIIKKFFKDKNKDKSKYKDKNRVEIESPAGFETLDIVDELSTDPLIEEVNPNWLTKIEAK